MNSEDYMRLSQRSAQSYPTQDEALVFAALEMTAEAGEVSNLVYKQIFQGHPHDASKLMEELGDVLWGMAFMCNVLGVSLSDVMEHNVAKLAKRYPHGWSREASLRRVDHDAPPRLELLLPVPPEEASNE